MKKVIMLGLVSLMSASVFASPHGCLRNKLTDVYGVNSNVTKNYKHMNEVQLPKMPAVYYTDHSESGYHSYYFNYTENVTRSEEQQLHDSASACHCTVKTKQYKDKRRAVVGWCWNH